jgi:thiamine-monophosphate kinase
MARTELQQLGEFGLIDHLAQHIHLQHPETLLGIGDDAAVIDQGNGLVTLVSKDLLVEGIHFDLHYTPLKHLGYKAIAVNVSDIAAMFGSPKQVLIGIAISNVLAVEDIEALYEGMRLACEDYKVDLVGGDTTSSKIGLVISVTVLGTAKKEEVVYRNGASENDILCVTGDLGAAFAGLQILEREKQVFLAHSEMQPELENYEYVIERLLKPKARMDIVYELKELGIQPTSMIDISDGLASEVLHLCRASKTGCALFEDKIPIDSQTDQTLLELNIDPITAALNGGEDYELLFTIKQTDFEKLKNSEHIHFIGYMMEAAKGKKLATKGGNSIDLKAQGWTHM